MIYSISGDDPTKRYNAKIELDEGNVLLHSRGGATGGRPPRNTEYQKALPVIIERLRAAETPTKPIISRILIDSLPARHFPPEERALVSSTDISGLSTTDLVKLVRLRGSKWRQTLGADGGNTTRALRIETIGLSQAEVCSMLMLTEWAGAGVPTNDIKRVLNADQRRVTSAHIERAITRLRAGEDMAAFGKALYYDVLLNDGVRLAPKKVFAMALEDALGIKVVPDHFHAGWKNPPFQIIAAAGYRIVKKGYALPSKEEVESALSDLPHDVEDRGAIEGNLKIAIHLRRERDAGLAKRKKAAFVAEHGRLYCERCAFDPQEKYGSVVAMACIEVHHARVEVKDMEGCHETKLEDLECLCANCHRVTHRAMSLGVEIADVII
jgi:hypothetical protein